MIERISKRFYADVETGEIKFVICSTCKVEKPVEEFYLSKSGKYSSRCKDCEREYLRRRRKRLKGEVKEGITKEEYRKNNIRVDEEGNVTHKRCKRCNEMLPVENYYLDKKRGIYHSYCNRCKKQYYREYLDRNKQLAELAIKRCRRIVEEEKEEEVEEVKVDPHWYGGRYALINPLLRRGLV